MQNNLDPNPIIGKTKYRGFVDGASQRKSSLCGVRGVMYLSERYYITLKLGLGGGTNNYSWLHALLTLLKVSCIRGLTKLKIFEDSNIVIKWVK